MGYAEAATFLFDLRRFRMKPGTAATARLLAHVDDPLADTAVVQIAGSDGKGSTARMLESVLRAADLDVGLYTSPHTDDVRNRIRVNGRPIPKSGVTEFVDAVEGYVTGQAADGIGPTFFEVLTAMALWHFGRVDVDVAVLEVGIGGRHDATSAVDPVASAVTNVSLEHTDVLGDSIEAIARDKANVAPADAPLVTAATGEALDAVRDEAGDVVVVGDDGDVVVRYGGVVDGREAAVTITGDTWEVDTRLPLLGAHQARNAGVAAVLARQVAAVDPGTVARGLRGAHWPGRFEVMSRSPLVVLDGAHTPDACAAVADVLDEFDYGDLSVVFGAMHDKDHGGMVDALPTPQRVVATRPNLDRAEDPTVLARVFERGGAGAVEAIASVEGAMDHVMAEIGADDAVLVTGSLYTVGEARARWTRTETPKRVDSLPVSRDVLAGSHVTDAGIERIAAKGVHRVLKLRVLPRQGRVLREELLALGGECALSTLDQQDEEPIDAVVMATLDQFDRLVEALDERPYGLPSIAADLRDALGPRTDPRAPGYPWEAGTAVMGILNVTPDSFHDGGLYASTEGAVERAREMTTGGADIIDVGGESTRPGATPVPVDEELDRVLPVIEEIRDLSPMVSIDTRKAEVARAALDAGADMINDVSGLEDPEMRFVAADRDVPLVVMHSLDTPVDPDRRVEYDDVVEDVISALGERVLLAETAGLDRSRIVVDPGIGFGKSPAENFEIVGRAGELHALGCPVLVGHSHKSMFDLVGRGPGDRGDPSIAASTIAAARGADIVRVHDVAANVAAIRTLDAATDPHSVDYH